MKYIETALQYSEMYEINCITMENEVVYSEGFLTRVGATKQYNQGQTKIMQFQKIIQIREDLFKSENMDKDLQKSIDSIQNE